MSSHTTAKTSIGLHAAARIVLAFAERTKLETIRKELHVQARKSNGGLVTGYVIKDVIAIAMECKANSDHVLKACAAVVDKYKYEYRYDMAKLKVMIFKSNITGRRYHCEHKLQWCCNKALALQIYLQNNKIR